MMPSHRLRSARGQRGVSLIYSLLALAAISLAAVALVRSVSTGNLVIGNLAFKQDATSAASIAAESAITWLNNNSASLTTDVTTAGYYASTRSSLDVTGASVSTTTRTVVDWDNDNCASHPSGSYSGCVDPNPTDIPVGSNTARYVILRQCSAEGNPATSSIDCTMPVALPTAQKTNASGLTYTNPEPLYAPASRQQYYRIIVRTRGARNTVAYTETLVTF